MKLFDEFLQEIVENKYESDKIIIAANRLRYKLKSEINKIKQEDEGREDGHTIACNNILEIL